MNLIAGMQVYVSALGVVKRAQANASGTARVCGTVVDASIAPSASGTIQLSAAVTLTTAQWDAVTGGSGGLSAGTYYLDPTTPGQITAVAPSASGNFICVLGDALSATTLHYRTQTPQGPIP